MAKKLVEVGVMVRLTEDEAKRHRARAEQEGVTMAGLFRKLAGLPARKRGGAMPGAGRPKKVSHG
jgi:hypothetical protein